MELLIPPLPFYGTLKRYWRRKRQYQRFDGKITGKRNIKVTRLGGNNSQRRSWKIKAKPKLRWKIASPLKLWSKVKNAYIDMMYNLAGNVGHLNTSSVFGSKRVPKARQLPVAYTSDEVEDRLVFEIYKVLLAARESAAPE